MAEYLNAWRHRFDLFDEQRPFYQSPSLPDKMLKSVSSLALEYASGNNPALFDHTLDNETLSLNAASAARRILAHQAFAPGGLVTGEERTISAQAAR